MYKQGQKVKVLDKTVDLPKDKSEVWNQIQAQGGYGYIVYINSRERMLDIGAKKSGFNGTFSFDDVIPYSEILELSTEL